MDSSGDLFYSRRWKSDEKKRSIRHTILDLSTMKRRKKRPSRRAHVRNRVRRDFKKFVREEKKRLRTIHRRRRTLCIEKEVAILRSRTVKSKFAKEDNPADSFSARFRFGRRFTRKKKRASFPFMWRAVQRVPSRRTILKAARRLKKAMRFVLSRQEDNGIDDLSEEEREQLTEESDALAENKTSLFVHYNSRILNMSFTDDELSVLELKERIASKLSIPTDYFYLTTQGGKFLNEKLALFEYNLQTNDSIQVMIRGPGGDRTPGGTPGTATAASAINANPTMNRRSREEIIESIGKRYDKLYWRKAGDETPHPYVCSICDEILCHENDISVIPLNTLKKCAWKLKWERLEESERIPAVEEQYRFNIENHRSGLNGPSRSKTAWMDELALSPRGCITKKKEDSRSPLGITSCNQCRNFLMNKNRKEPPFFSIINHNFSGDAPECLTELTEIELAMITPVKTYGFVFSYKGGKQKKTEREYGLHARQRA